MIPSLSSEAMGRQAGFLPPREVRAGVSSKFLFEPTIRRAANERGDRFGGEGQREGGVQEDHDVRVLRCELFFSLRWGRPLTILLTSALSNGFYHHAKELSFTASTLLCCHHQGCHGPSAEKQSGFPFGMFDLRRRFCLHLGFVGASVVLMTSLNMSRFMSLSSTATFPEC